MSKKGSGRKAWLVTWDWAGDHAAVPEQEVVAAILRPQTSPKTVKELMERLYAAHEFSAADKLSALTYNPYPAHFGSLTVNERLPSGATRPLTAPFVGQIYCGHNPFLYARLVDNLRVDNEVGIGLSWDERPLPRVPALEGD
jgi:hypothetical protein